MENYTAGHECDTLYKEEYIKYLTEVGANREGMDKLIQYLSEKTDFFEAPAGLDGLESREGGLLRHSLNVLQRLFLEVGSESVMKKGNAEASHALIDSCTIIALLGNIWKANYFQKEQKEVCTSDDKPELVTQYSIRDAEDRLCYGRDDDHGDAAVYIISGFIRLTRQEALIIRSQDWSMNSVEAMRLFKKYPLALSYHVAKMKASVFDEGAICR